jgi:hypothetical protein
MAVRLYDADISEAIDTICDRIGLEKENIIMMEIDSSILTVHSYLRDECGLYVKDDRGDFVYTKNFFAVST